MSLSGLGRHGEIEAAAGELPALVELDDVRGDVQLHTDIDTDADGTDYLGWSSWRAIPPKRRGAPIASRSY